MPRARDPLGNADSVHGGHALGMSISNTNQFEKWPPLARSGVTTGWETLQEHQSGLPINTEPHAKHIAYRPGYDSELRTSRASWVIVTCKR